MPRNVSSKNTSKYQASSDNSAPKNSYKKIKGEDMEDSSTDTRGHCNGCGKQHKPPFRFEYKAEYSTDESTPSAQSSACREATTRRVALSQKPL